MKKNDTSLLIYLFPYQWKQFLLSHRNKPSPVPSPPSISHLPQFLTAVIGIQKFRLILPLTLAIAIDYRWFFLPVHCLVVYFSKYQFPNHKWGRCFGSSAPNPVVGRSTPKMSCCVSSPGASKRCLLSKVSRGNIARPCCAAGQKWRKLPVDGRSHHNDKTMPLVNRQLARLQTQLSTGRCNEVQLAPDFPCYLEPRIHAVKLYRKAKSSRSVSVPLFAKLG